MLSFLPAIPWWGHHEPHHAATEGGGWGDAAGDGGAQAEEGSCPSQAVWVHVWCGEGRVREGECDVWRKSRSRWLHSALSCLTYSMQTPTLFLPNVSDLSFCPSLLPHLPAHPPAPQSCLSLLPLLSAPPYPSLLPLPTAPPPFRLK